MLCLLLLLVSAAAVPLPMFQVSDPPAYPGPVAASSVADRDGNILYFGGRINETVSSDLFFLNASSLVLAPYNLKEINSWAHPVTHRHCCASSLSTNIMYCYGGVNAPARISRLDMQERKWLEPISIPSDADERERFGHTCTVSGDKMLIWGGITHTTQGEKLAAKNTIVYDVKTNTFNVSPSTNSRHLHSAAILPSKTVIMFGLEGASSIAAGSSILSLDSSNGSRLANVSINNPEDLISGSSCIGVGIDIYCFGGEVLKPGRQDPLASATLWKLSFGNDATDSKWEVLWDINKEPQVQRRHLYPWNSKPKSQKTTSENVITKTLPTTSVSEIDSYSGTPSPATSHVSEPSGLVSGTVFPSPTTSTSSISTSPTIRPSSDLYPSRRWFASIASINSTLLVIWGGGTSGSALNETADSSLEDTQLYFYDLKLNKWVQNPAAGYSKPGEPGVSGPPGATEPYNFIWIIIIALLAAIFLTLGFVFWKYKKPKKDAKLSAQPVPVTQSNNELDLNPKTTERSVVIDMTDEPLLDVAERDLEGADITVPMTTFHDHPPTTYFPVPISEDPTRDNILERQIDITDCYIQAPDFEKTVRDSCTHLFDSSRRSSADAGKIGDQVRQLADTPTCYTPSPIPEDPDSRNDSAERLPMDGKENGNGWKQLLQGFNTVTAGLYSMLPRTESVAASEDTADMNEPDRYPGRNESRTTSYGIQVDENECLLVPAQGEPEGNLYSERRLPDELNDHLHLPPGTLNLGHSDDISKPLLSSQEDTEKPEYETLSHGGCPVTDEDLKVPVYATIPEKETPEIPFNNELTTVSVAPVLENDKIFEKLDLPISTEELKASTDGNQIEKMDKVEDAFDKTADLPMKAIFEDGSTIWNHEQSNDDLKPAKSCVDDAFQGEVVPIVQAISSESEYKPETDTICNSLSPETNITSVKETKSVPADPRSQDHLTKPELLLPEIAEISQDGKIVDTSDETQSGKINAVKELESPSAIMLDGDESVSSASNVEHEAISDNNLSETQYPSDKTEGIDAENIANYTTEVELPFSAVIDSVLPDLPVCEELPIPSASQELNAAQPEQTSIDAHDQDEESVNVKDTETELPKLVQVENLSEDSRFSETLETDEPQPPNDHGYPTTLEELSKTQTSPELPAVSQENEKVLDFEDTTSNDKVNPGSEILIDSADVENSEPILLQSDKEDIDTSMNQNTSEIDPSMKKVLVESFVVIAESSTPSTQNAKEELSQNDPEIPDTSTLIPVENSLELSVHEDIENVIVGLSSVSANNSEREAKNNSPEECSNILSEQEENEHQGTEYPVTLTTEDMIIMDKESVDSQFLKPTDCVANQSECDEMIAGANLNDIDQEFNENIEKFIEDETPILPEESDQSDYPRITTTISEEPPEVDVSLRKEVGTSKETPLDSMVPKAENHAKHSVYSDASHEMENDGDPLAVTNEDDTNYAKQPETCSHALINEVVELTDEPMTNNNTDKFLMEEVYDITQTSLIAEDGSLLDNILESPILGSINPDNVPEMADSSFILDERQEFSFSSIQGVVDLKEDEPHPVERANAHESASELKEDIEPPGLLDLRTAHDDALYEEENNRECLNEDSNGTLDCSFLRPDEYLRDRWSNIDDSFENRRYSTISTAVNSGVGSSSSPFLEHGTLQTSWPPQSPKMGPHSRDVSNLNAAWPPVSPKSGSNGREVSSLNAAWPPPAPIGIDVPDLTVVVPGQTTDYVVIRPFFPTRKDEIPVGIGDLIAVECRWDDGWVRVQNVTRGRRRGVIPMNALKEIRSGPSRRVQSVRTVFLDPSKNSVTEGIQRKSFVPKHVTRAMSEARNRGASRFGPGHLASTKELDEDKKELEKDSDEEDEKRERTAALDRIKIPERVSSLYRGEGVTSQT